jgi:hypothetical protein
MTWNYRVVKTVLNVYVLKACYYASKTHKNPHSYAAGPSTPMGETKEELRSELKRMLAALDKPAYTDEELLSMCSKKYKEKP